MKLKSKFEFLILEKNKKMAKTDFYFIFKFIKKIKKNALFNILCQILKLNTFPTFFNLFLTFYHKLIILLTYVWYIYIRNAHKYSFIYFIFLQLFSWLIWYQYVHEFFYLSIIKSSTSIILKLIRFGRTNFFKLS